MKRSRMYVKKINRISFVDNGACGGVPGNGGADIAIMKRAEKPEKGDPMDPKDKKKTDKVDLEKLDQDALKRVASELTEKNATLEADNAKLNERLTALEEESKKRATPIDDDGPLDLTDEVAFKAACKGHSEATVRVFKAMRQQAIDAKKEAAEATKRSEDAEKRANEERDARELEVLTTKARKDLAGLSGKPETIAAILQTAKRSMPDQYTELERVLQGASERAIKGRIDRELGEDPLGDDESTATDVVMKRAEVLVAEKKAEDIGDAMSQVLRDDRNLRERYERESTRRV